MIRPAAFAVLRGPRACPALAAGMAFPPDGSSANPSQPGPFAPRVKFSQRAVVGPHAHAADGSLTIFSGVLTREMGENLDKAAGGKVGSGGFVRLPGNMPHSTWIGDDPVEPQVAGTRPLGSTASTPRTIPA